jgi:hypothetical protein
MLLVLLCMRDTKSDASAAVGVSAVAQRCTSRIPLELAGAPEEIRTPDPQIRSLLSVYDCLRFHTPNHISN